MFVATVFRGSRAWVFDPARRPGMPVLRLAVSTACGSGVRTAAWGDCRTAPQRVLLLPGQTEGDVVDRLMSTEFGDPGLPQHDCTSPGGGVPVGWADAAFDLAAWRGRVTGLADDPGRAPELLAALRSRPDALAGPAGSYSPTVVNGLLARAEALPGHAGPSDQRQTGADYPTAAPNLGAEWSHAAAVVDGVVARRRLMASLAADEARDLDLLSREYPGVDQFLATEVGRALGMTDARADRLIDRAQTLVRRLPATLHALGTGRISIDVADAVLAATVETTDGVAAAVEAAVVPKATGRTYQQVYQSCAYRVMRLDAEASRRRHEKAVSQRHVRRRVLEDGMAELAVISTAQDIAAIWQALTAFAEHAKARGDDRDVGNRRVDALVDLCIGALDRFAGWDAGRLPAPFGLPESSVAESGSETDSLRSATARGCACGGCSCDRPMDNRRSRRNRTRRRRAQVRVTMPLSALLGGDAPAWLEGHGWISGEQARQIAADAELTRLVCDPLTGLVVDAGRTVYRPPEALARKVRARDQTCVMPGCPRPADLCDLDHVVPAKPHPRTGKPTEGPTDQDNLGPGCRHHHLCKDGMGWDVVRHPDGSYTWTSPLGRDYVREPVDLLGDPEYARGGPGADHRAAASGTDGLDHEVEDGDVGSVDLADEDIGNVGNAEDVGRADQADDSAGIGTANVGTANVDTAEDDERAWEEADWRAGIRRAHEIAEFERLRSQPKPPSDEPPPF